MSCSTQRILAERALNRTPSAAWVCWAVERLVAGDDTDSLRVLAGESAPFDALEMDRLVDKALSELRITRPPREMAVLNYAVELVHRLSDTAPTDQDALAELRELYLEADYVKSLQEFYLLSYAADDLKTQSFQYYWPDATRDNLEAIVRQQAAKWLADWIASGAA